MPVRERAKEEEMTDRIAPHDREIILSRVYPELVNRERNQDLLRTAACTAIGDMAVIWYYHDPDTSEKFLVTEDKLKRWNTTEHNLFFRSLDNADRGSVVYVNTDYIPIRLFADMTGKGTEMTAYRCEGGITGAAAMLQNGVLVRFADKHGDIYIIPYDTDKVYLIPETETEKSDVSADTLKKSLYELARRADKEVLSDSLYSFSLKDCRIRDLGRYIPQDDRRKENKNIC